MGIWEELNNYGEFAIIKSQARLNSYKLSVKEWVEKTNAIGITSKVGRYGGTCASDPKTFIIENNKKIPFCDCNILEDEIGCF